MTLRRNGDHSNWQVNVTSYGGITPGYAPIYAPMDEDVKIVCAQSEEEGDLALLTVPLGGYLKRKNRMFMC